MKKAKKKYQIGGISNVPEIKPLDAGSLESQQELIPNFPSQINVMEGTGDLNYHPLFKLFNILAQATTSIGNKIGDVKTDIRNRKTNIQALQQPNFKNTTQEGLNSAPAYYQTGGRLIPEDQVESYTKKGYTPIENRPNYYRKAEATGETLAQAPTTTNIGGGDAYNQKLIELLQQGHSIEDLAAKGYGTPDGLKQFESYYKPTEDIVYTQPTKPQPTHIDMGVRMFDGNAAIGDAGWREQTGTTTDPGEQSKFWNFQPIDANGNPTEDMYENIPDDEWYTATSGHNRLSKDKLEGFSKYKRQPLVKLQAGGQDGNPVLEEGEVYENAQGDINKIPDDAGTHEEGGATPVDEVEKVLEDTSDKRKDKASKLLKMQPKTVEAILGFKPKTSLSHSKAHEKAIEFYNKKSKAIISKVDKNLKATKENSSDKYAFNSLKFNDMTMNTLPTEEEMFDKLFDHQEKVKSLFGIQDDGKKAQYGIKAYKGDKKFKGNSSKYSDQEWQEMAKDLGFEGGDTRKFQEFLLNQQGEAGAPDLQSAIMGLHSKFGDPNTPPAKGTVMNWTDNRLGHRWDAAYDAWKASKAPQDTVTRENDYDIGNLPQADASIPSTNTTTNIVNTYQRGENGFNFPLKWYDVAGPLSAYLGANKAHINYNPIDIHQLQLKGLNPLPTLQRGQADFNAELDALRSTGVNGGVQFANIGNLYAKKYAMNNEVLGNYENANAGIKNKEIEYNTQAADRQSAANAQARDVFEQKNLATDEAVRQQKLTAADSLYTRIAQNKKFNFEGSLLLKLFPNFNAQGNYTGKQYSFHNPLNTNNGDIDSILIQNNINPQGLTPNQKAVFLSKLIKTRK